MLRFIILLIFATNLYAKNIETDQELLANVESFAANINESLAQNLPVNETLPTKKRERLMVFISSSMSDQSIKQWAKQAKTLDAELVLRGFINNDFKQTVDFAQRLFLKDKIGGFNIDPFLFKKYAVEAVPLVVLDIGGVVDSVAGDIGLFEALKIISERGENRLYAKNILAKN